MQQLWEPDVLVLYFVKRTGLDYKVFKVQKSQNIVIRLRFNYCIAYMHFFFSILLFYYFLKNVLLDA